MYLGRGRAIEVMLPVYLEAGLYWVGSVLLSDKVPPTGATYKRYDTRMKAAELLFTTVLTRYRRIYPKKI
jgi:hypothetical protein